MTKLIQNPYFQILDTIGYTGPILLFLINIYEFFHRKLYLYAYLLSFFVNTFINATLKMIYKIPRQSNQIYFSKYENFEGVNAYGMPSGHSQSVGFSTTFLFLGQSNSYLLVTALFISCLTFIQRYKYRRHTIMELIIGFIIGICFAYIVFNTTKYYLETQTHSDDKSIFIYI